MAEIKKVATRESYGATLAELASEYPNLVVLDADLAGATKTANFKKVCPERFIDCGIAEGNMMGVAAGLAAAGMIPFASSFAMFAAGRAFEQVRNSIGYPHLNVKIGATHAGISVGEDGATHQCCEDIALMRSIPGMVVINPADDVEARAAVRAAVEYVGPVYLRFGRLAVPVINDREDYKFELGKGVVLREGKDLTIVATGLPVSNCLEAAEKLAAENGWKIVEISLRAKNAEKTNRRMFYEAGVEEFLSLTKYAECVVTNSLHGTIFAVQYSKPLCVFSREQCDTKIKELLAFNGGVRYGGILDRQR